MLSDLRLLGRGRTGLSMQGHAPEAEAPPAATRLVLFVGAALRPDGALAAELARDGVRTLWRASTEQAVRTAQLATFDAVCMDTTTLGAGTVGVIRRLREALTCPLLIVGSGVDPREEIEALEQGVDLYLTRPLPPRRLCAHLLALLRRQGVMQPPRSQAQAEGPMRRELPHEGAASTSTSALPAQLIESLLSAVSRGHAVAEMDGAVSVRASGASGGLEVTIRGLQLRLR